MVNGVIIPLILVPSSSGLGIFAAGFRDKILRPIMSRFAIRPLLQSIRLATKFSQPQVQPGDHELFAIVSRLHSLRANPFGAGRKAVPCPAQKTPKVSAKIAHRMAMEGRESLPSRIIPHILAPVVCFDGGSAGNRCGDPFLRHLHHVSLYLLLQIQYTILQANYRIQNQQELCL